MQIQNIFSNFIAYEQLDIDHDEIADWCLQQDANGNLGTKFISAKQDKINLSLDEQKLIPLYEKVTKCFQEVHNSIGLKPELKEYINEAWVNLGTTTRTSEPHYHADRSLVAVYYPRIDDSCDKLILVNPVNVAEWVFPRSKIEDYTVYTGHREILLVQKGMLIIFPSWIMHYVLGDGNNSQRISIAFNAKIGE